MARTTPRPEPTAHCTLLPLTTTCPACGGPLSLDYSNERTVTTVQDVARLRLGIRRCPRHPRDRHRKPVRPEAEGRIALPHHEFGLDVVARVGSLRYLHHKSLPEIHQELTARRLVLARRSVGNLEQLFGSYRHHERRVSGRKQGSEGLVVRGGVRLLAALATRLEGISAEELAPRDLQQWRPKRRDLGRRRQARAQQKRFRRDPDSFLRQLEDKLCQSPLPP